MVRKRALQGAVDTLAFTAAIAFAVIAGERGKLYGAVAIASVAAFFPLFVIWWINPPLELLEAGDRPRAQHFGALLAAFIVTVVGGFVVWLVTH